MVNQLNSQEIDSPLQSVRLAFGMSNIAQKYLPMNQKEEPFGLSRFYILLKPGIFPED